jgi:hypothetical protein
MMPLKDDKRQPPEFLYKDYHDATMGSEDNSSPPATAGIQTTPISGRKTRNSNGSRGGSLRPGLRSAKASFLKSDTDEDDGKHGVKNCIRQLYDDASIRCIPPPHPTPKIVSLKQ